MKRMIVAFGTAALLAMIVLPLIAAEPPTGSISSQQKSTTWKGGPIVASNPGLGGCAGGASDPTCDHFLLTVNASNKAMFMVAIKVPEGSTDDYDLQVFYPDGSEAAASAHGGGNESVIVEHRTDKGTGPYEVRVQPYLVTPTSTYDGVAMLQRGGTPSDITRECLEPIPDAIGLTGVTDMNEKVTLNTTVLYDGITLDQAKAVMNRAAYSYVVMKTPLVVNRYRKVNFATDDAEALIQLAKNLYGGRRPQDSDLVYVLTSKDIHVGGDTGVAGLADCIGGVRFATRAFAVGELFAGEDEEIGPFTLYHEVTPKIAAHELGHLMGAHHHYANCLESKAEYRDVAPCTLMFPYLDFQALNMGQLEQLVVRGHALKYAKP